MPKSEEFSKHQTQKRKLSSTKVPTAHARQTQDAIDQTTNAMVPDRVSENRIKLEKAQYLVNTAELRVTAATLDLEAATVELEAATVQLAFFSSNLAKAKTEYDD